MPSRRGPSGPEAEGGQQELHLEVYQDRSELHKQDGTREVFPEGTQSAAARERYRRIQATLRDGFLQSRIDALRADPEALHDLSEEHKQTIDRLVAQVTSEVGRALVGLSVLQLVIKAIDPDQSVRLHKGGGGANRFSWQEGISMRSLDSGYIVPTLRSNGLLSVNASGVMMTRGLAENYPYTEVYKAALRGPRRQWIDLIEALESGALDAEAGLRYLLSKLIQRSAAFSTLVDDSIAALDSYLAESPDADAVQDLILRHINESPHSARLLEVAMHALMQCLAEEQSLDGDLRPLGQMRSANKKAGNVGDIEVVQGAQRNNIIEAWDAKFGRPYLRDEVDELGEKLAEHPEIERAGFVVDRNPDIPPDLSERILEIGEEFGVTISILPFVEWVTGEMGRSTSSRDEIARCWIRAYVESLCLRRPDLAPIDEPTEQWVRDLLRLLSVD